MTLAETAYAALRRDIISGALAPDVPLRMAFLCDRYGMGMSPLREALSRLQAERLVTAMPLRGFVVAPLRAAELSDTTATRILIETEALRRSIASGGPAWETGIRDALAAMLQGLGAGPGLEDLHHSFHRALIAACESRWLLDLFETLYSEAERYRYHALTSGGAGTGRDLAAEHQAIAAATLARDADQAAALLAQHYRLTESGLQALLPEPEVDKPRRRKSRSGA